MQGVVDSIFPIYVIEVHLKQVNSKVKSKQYIIYIFITMIVVIESTKKPTC
jgi:hypothetical protein